MNDAVRHQLRELAIAYGPSIWADQRLCRSLLRDAFPTAPRAVNVLLAALDHRVPHDLAGDEYRDQAFPVPPELIRRLIENLAMEEAAARWAVAGWAAAVRSAGVNPTQPA